MRLIAHGDVSASLLAVTERSTVDLLWGIGGTPEGVISAAAVKCLGGQLLGRLWPRDETERRAALDAGYDLERVLTRDDLIAGEDVFFSATGITDGDVLQGVRYPSAGGATHRVAGDAHALGHGPADQRPRTTARSWLRCGGSRLCGGCGVTRGCLSPASSPPRPAGRREPSHARLG